MPQTNNDMLARSFFDLATKVEQIAASDVALAVETFDNDDYASVVATLLDAAYWILAGQLDEELKDDPLGHNLYTSSSVYNDLLYRGYSPGWAWEESGMSEMFGHANDHLDAPTTASGLKPGDYVLAKHEDATVTGGMIISNTEMFSFDGRRDPLVGLILTKISTLDAQALMEKHAQDILKNVESWVDGKATEYRNRLHLLIHNEPHPDTLESFESQIRWQPQALSRQYQRLFRAVTADLSSVQRLMVKLSLKMILTAEEAMFLRMLHEQGRYRCDPEPEVYLFCVGRAGGKSTTAARTAFLLNFIQGTRMWVSNPILLNHQSWLFANGMGDLPESSILTTTSQVEVSEPFHVMDEMLMGNGWQEFIQNNNRERVISFFSLLDKEVLPDIDRPCMALSIDNLTAYPAAYRPYGYLTPQQRLEFMPPPVNDWFHHPWGQDK